MDEPRKRRVVEAGIGVAVAAVTLATWAAAGVFGPGHALPSLAARAASGRSSSIVAPSPAVPADSGAGGAAPLAPAVVAALTAPVSGPAQVVGLPVGVAVPTVRTGVAPVDGTAGQAGSVVSAATGGGHVTVDVDPARSVAGVRDVVGGTLDATARAVAQLVGGAVGTGR